MTDGQSQNASGHVSWLQPENPADDTHGNAANAPLSDRPLTQAQSKQKAKAATSRRARKSDSAFRTISEVADVLDVQQHVLRFWETKFSQVRPLKRGGGRRYYRPEDVELLQRIHHLLYTEKYTIKGVQKLLKEQGKKAVLDGSYANDTISGVAGSMTSETANAQARSVRAGLSQSQRSLLESTLSDLQALRGLVG